MINQPFFIRDDGMLKKINLDEIVLLQIEDNYLRVMAANYSYQIRATLQGTLDQLPPGQFVQIHRSIAVAVHHIEEVGKDLVMVCGKPIPLSKKYYPELMSRLNIIE